MIDLEADRACCEGAAGGGIKSCTCWREELDQEQQPWNGEQPYVRGRCCFDCASLPGSPEHVDRARFSSGTVWEGLQQQAKDRGAIFLCHRNERGETMAKVVRRVNEVDGRVEQPDGDCYRHGIGMDGEREIPLLASGAPAPICAAFARMARAAGWDPLFRLRALTGAGTEQGRGGKPS